MRTLLYFVRAGRNEELRYSLRSVEKNFPHDRIVVVGDKPEWLVNVEFHQGNAQADKWRNVYSNLMLATKRVPGSWVVMNDDFFVLQPTVELGSWYRGLLVDHLRLIKYRRGAWYRSLVATEKMLLDMGFDRPRSYELHLPVEMEAQKLGEVLKLGRYMNDLPQWRSLYGNYWGVSAVQHVDVRLGMHDNVAGYRFVSTNDNVFDKGGVGAQVRAMFKTPSKYEKDGV